MTPSDPGSGSPLRILLLCYEYPPVGGGGGVGAQQFAEAWADAGHEVTVVTSRASGLPAEERHGRLRVVRVATMGKKNRATSTGLSMLSYLVTGFLHLLRRRRHYSQFDLINTHFALPTGPLGYVAQGLLGLPNVLTIIGGDIYDPTKSSSPHRYRSLRAVNRFLLRRADEIVAISSDTRSRAEVHYGTTRSMHLIPHGFEPPSATEAPDLPRGALDDKFVLVTIGRLVERKGYEHLIRSLSLLPGDSHLLVVGDGPLEPSLRRVAEEVGVTDRITWLGYVPRAQLYGALEAADCYVLSSLHEGLGLVVLEAMWAGLPIVATNNGGQVDLVTQGENGFLVDPGDPESLADGIRRLRDDPELRSRMARHNQSDVEKHYVGRRAEQYVKLFRTVTGQEAGSPGLQATPSMQDR